MNPVAFSIFGYDIRWYGIMIATGMLLGILVSKYTCRLRNADFDTFINIILIAIPSGVLGARLYYVAFEFQYYKNHISDILNIRQGGLAIHGGILFGVLAALIYTSLKKINFLQYADAAAPAIILGQAIGRWGNFFNQEAHGGPVSKEFISHFPGFIQRGMFIEGVYYHPTFLYESISNLIIFILLILLLKNVKRYGMVAFTYIGLYSLGRYFIEGLRTDSLMLGNFRIAQIVSMIGILISIISWLIYFTKRKY